LEEKRTTLLTLLRPDPKKQQVHRGMVLDLGEPGTLDGHPESPVVPWDVKVGDVVVFVMGVWLDSMRTLEFVGVEGDVIVVAQVEIVGVEI
jgi:hypothetical protein